MAHYLGWCACITRSNSHSDRTLRNQERRNDGGGCRPDQPANRPFGQLGTGLARWPAPPQSRSRPKRFHSGGALATALPETENGRRPVDPPAPNRGWEPPPPTCSRRSTPSLPSEIGVLEINDSISEIRSIVLLLSWLSAHTMRGMPVRLPGVCNQVCVSQKGNGIAYLNVI
jgi:hypothetical protein